MGLWRRKERVRPALRGGRDSQHGALGPRRQHRGRQRRRGRNHQRAPPASVAFARCGPSTTTSHRRSSTQLPERRSRTPAPTSRAAPSVLVSMHAPCVVPPPKVSTPPSRAGQWGSDRAHGELPGQSGRFRARPASVAPARARKRRNSKRRPMVHTRSPSSATARTRRRRPRHPCSATGREGRLGSL